MTWQIPPLENPELIAWPQILTESAMQISNITIIIIQEITPELVHESGLININDNTRPLKIYYLCHSRESGNDDLQVSGKIQRSQNRELYRLFRPTGRKQIIGSCPPLSRLICIDILPLRPYNWAKF
jgi:hypothetical protein